ncbi:MAG: hypothetical protein ACRC4T_06565 [Cetobacterium sp.]
MEIITIYWDHHCFNQIKGFEYGLYQFDFKVKKTLTKKYKLLNKVPENIFEIFKLPFDYYSDCYIKCKTFSSFGYVHIEGTELVIVPISSEKEFKLNEVIKRYEI